MTDQAALFNGLEEEWAEAATTAMNAVTQGLKQEMRDLTEAAGLGRRLAFTWQGRRYPQTGASLEPAGYVWTKAGNIMSAFTDGAVIAPTDGRRYLAIPTKAVPMKGRGRRMTPLDVEVAFNQDLIIRQGRGRNLWAFVNAVASANRRGFKPATKGRLRQGRQSQLVLMFVLTPLVRISRRIDAQAAADRWAAKFETAFASAAVGRASAAQPPLKAVRR